MARVLYVPSLMPQMATLTLACPDMAILAGLGALLYVPTLGSRPDHRS